jgi:hypothetical protein
MVVCGISCLHVAMKSHKDSIVAEVNSMLRLMMLLQSKARSYETIAIVLLVGCWMPCSNAAWLTDAKYRKLQRQIALIETANRNTQIAGAAHEISERVADDRESVDYEIDLGNGATVSWAASGANNERTNRAIGTTLEMRGDRRSTWRGYDTDSIADNAGPGAGRRTPYLSGQHAAAGDSGAADF